MKVRDLMKREAEFCRPGSDLAEAAMIMWRQDCGVVPVVDEEGLVVGLITDRDICMAVATRHLRAEEIHVGEVMSGRVHSVGEGDDIGVAFDRMSKEQVRRLPVVDAAGRLLGMFSITDAILHAHGGAGRALPGEIPSGEVVQVLRDVSAHPLLPVAKETAIDELIRSSV